MRRVRVRATRCVPSLRPARHGETSRRPSVRSPRATRGPARPRRRVGRPATARRACRTPVGRDQCSEVGRIPARSPVVPPDREVLERRLVEPQHGDPADPLGPPRAARDAQHGPSGAFGADELLEPRDRRRVEDTHQVPEVLADDDVVRDLECSLLAVAAHERRAISLREQRHGEGDREERDGCERGARPACEADRGESAKAASRVRDLAPKRASAGKILTTRRPAAIAMSPGRSRSRSAVPSPRASWSSSAAPPRSATAITRSAAPATTSSTPTRAPSRDGSDTVIQTSAAASRAVATASPSPVGETTLSRSTSPTGAPERPATMPATTTPAIHPRATPTSATALDSMPPSNASCQRCAPNHREPAARRPRGRDACHVPRES